MNKATSGLTVFDDPFFKFEDDADEYHPVYYPITNLYSNLKILPYLLAEIFTSTYTELKEDYDNQVYRMWFNNSMVNFYQRWLLRTNNLKHIKVTRIIDTLVTFEVLTLFEFHRDERTEAGNKDRQRFAMYHIHRYIKLHLNLLSKKFVFFPVNETDYHWWGWVAINPRCHLSKVLALQLTVKDKGKLEDLDTENLYACGLLACDGLGTRKVKDSLPFIWFLNLVLAYRDMVAEDQYKMFDIKNHNPRSYWIMGCCGPFGIVDPQVLGKITYPILRLDNKIKLKQVDDA